MPAVNDIIEARIKARCCGEPVVTTFGLAVVNPQESWRAQLDALVADFESAGDFIGPAGSLVTGLSSQYVLDSLVMVDVSPGTQGSLAYTLSGAGTVVDDDAMPPNDCMCISWRSDFKGPGARGRTYLTGFAEGSANAGYWEAGAQTYAVNLITNLLSVFGETGTGSHRMCVIHKSSNGGVRNAPILPLVPPEIKPIMTANVHNEVRSLGRRAVGRRIRRVRV